MNSNRLGRSYETIAVNIKAIADYKTGKTKAAQAIKGAVMRETKGAAKGKRTRFPWFSRLFFE